MTHQLHDKLITCKCGKEFDFTIGEQRFYEMKGFPSPKRCHDCREKKGRQRDGRDQAPASNNSSQMKENKDLGEGKVWGECASCGYETVLVEEVGLCGPCCFGDAETLNGNW